MPPAIKSVSYQPIGEIIFVGKKHKCIVLVAPKRVTVIQEQRTSFPAVSSTNSKWLFRAGDNIVVVERPNSNCEEAKKALRKRVKELEDEATRVTVESQ